MIYRVLIATVLFLFAGTTYSHGQWIEDHLDSSVENMTIRLTDDYEGEVVTTLVRRVSTDPLNNSAVLYIHGFNDYFFQLEMAQEFNYYEWDFYAVDLRKYGRSCLPHQKRGNVRDLNEYFEDIDSCLNIINREGYERVVLMGHSTGGLISTLYLADREDTGKIDGLILNSPFFDMNLNWFLENIAVPVASTVGHIIPKAELKLPSDNNYARSIHKDMDGEWDYNLEWKPATSIPINLGWLKAINRGHKRVQKGSRLPDYGLKIESPVLVLHSDKSIKDNQWSENYKISDCVLDVKDIAKYSLGIGSNVSIAVIEDGLHDLVLSRKDVRESVYDTIFNWLSGIDSQE